MDRRGSLYVIALGVLFVLSIAGASLLSRGFSETQVTARSRNQHLAFQLADAGIDQAAINLRTAGTGDDLLAAALPTGSFSILSAVPLDSLTQRVTVRGIASSEQRDVEAVIRLSPQSVFQFALFGDQTVNVTGSGSTDSYNSATGPYDPNAHEHNGDVGTNATTAGGVTVSGSIFIDGQVAVGPNVSPPEAVVIGYNPSFITGNPKVVSQPSAFPMPAVSLPPGLTCDDYTVTGNTTVTLSAGTYCYDDLTIQGNATLTASGPVTIYMTGALRAQGNSSVGVASDPAMMLFLMSGGTEATLEEGTITGSNEFYGALYGPNATINITGNAEVFGSIIARQVNLSGSAWIHYDEALAQLTGISNRYTTDVIFWRDL